MTGASRLPIIESCRGCGACCLHVRSPPFVVYADLVDGNYRALDDASAAELARLLSAPPEALAARDIGTTDTRPEDAPCSWLDLETLQCRFYEHRPAACREFELGGALCRDWRERVVGLASVTAR